MTAAKAIPLIEVLVRKFQKRQRQAILASRTKIPKIIPQVVEQFGVDTHIASMLLEELWLSCDRQPSAGPAPPAQLAQGPLEELPVQVPWGSVHCTWGCVTAQHIAV